MLSELNYLGDVMKLELGEQQLYSRDQVTLISGQSLAVGAVLGRISLAAATETHAGNTGNGVMTLDITTPVLANAKAGVYTVKCTAAASNSGTFRVFTPAGAVLGDVAVAATFSDQIKFVIADGSADFIVGDTFLVTVAAGSLKLAVLAPAALNGTQDAVGVLAKTTDATSADVATVMIARNAVLASNKVVWPGGITAGQQAAATTQLAALGIILRTGV